MELPCEESYGQYGSEMLGILRRNLKKCAKNMKYLAYKLLLGPNLEYACSIWDPYAAMRFTTSRNWKEFKDDQHIVFATNTAIITALHPC